MKNLVTVDGQRVSPGEGSAPGSIGGIDVDTGQEVTFKAWPDMLAQFQSHKSFTFEWYLGKEYKGVQDMIVSKHGEVREVGSAVSQSNGSHSPVEASPAPKAPIQVVTPSNTPQGVMTSSQGTKERTITCLAIMKSVIESGGTEADFDRWLAKHDSVVFSK